MLGAKDSLEGAVKMWSNKYQTGLCHEIAPFEIAC